MILTASQLLKIAPGVRSRYMKYLPYINKYLDEFEINTPLRLCHWLAQVLHESGEFKYTQELASGKAYEGRKDLGNTSSGDGMKYKGRGLIQITGKANYEAYKKYCGFDVVSNPSLLELPLGAVRSSMWFFSVYKGLNKYADKDDVVTITKKINGGLNGFAQRKEYLRRAKLVIK